MKNVRPSRKGFTLIEILIVVIILGILAAIVIPQFTNASTDARNSNVRSQLQTLRSQIELYKLQHNDTPPDLTGTNGWTVMTEYTDISGAPVTTKDATHIYGPYYQTAPVNPLSNSSTCAAALGTAGTGWIYDGSTGTVSATADSTGASAFQE
jgi:general secretion pathway protein G